MQAIKNVFLGSLFFVVTILLAIWFYPGISEEFSGFNSSVQGGVGSGTSAYFLALNALDIGAALLCASALFYMGMLIARRKKAVANTQEPQPAISPAAIHGKKSAHNRRLLLIPIWFLAQYIHNLFSGIPFGQALAMMTSIESLWYSVVVVTVIVLYARNYQVVFGKVAKQPQKPAALEK